MATINGTDNDDNLTGTADGDSISALAGNDVIDGGLGDDQIDGGAGSDTVNYLTAGGAVDVFLGARVFQARLFPFLQR